MDPIKKQIDELGLSLRKLQRHFLEQERQLAEGRLGRTIGPLDFFNLLTQDADFKWIQPFSILITKIDASSSPKVPTGPADLVAMRDEVRLVLFKEKSKIKERYDYYLEHDEDFMLLHKDLEKLLGQIHDI